MHCKKMKVKEREVGEHDSELGKARPSSRYVIIVPLLLITISPRSRKSNTARPGGGSRRASAVEGESWMPPRGAEVSWNSDVGSAGVNTLGHG